MFPRVFGDPNSLLSPPDSIFRIPQLWAVPDSPRWVKQAEVLFPDNCMWMTSPSKGQAHKFIIQPFRGTLIQNHLCLEAYADKKSKKKPLGGGAVMVPCGVFSLQQKVKNSRAQMSCPAQEQRLTQVTVQQKHLSHTYHPFKMCLIGYLNKFVALLSPPLPSKIPSLILFSTAHMSESKKRWILVYFKKRWAWKLFLKITNCV